VADCVRHGTSAPVATTALTSGTLPAGCSVVVHVDVVALRPLLEALGVAAGADATVMKTLAELAPGPECLFRSWRRCVRRTRVLQAVRRQRAPLRRCLGPGCARSLGHFTRIH
jgi:hypothetical protein